MQLILHFRLRIRLYSYRLSIVSCPGVPILFISIPFCIHQKNLLRQNFRLLCCIVYSHISFGIFQNPGIFCELICCKRYKIIILIFSSGSGHFCIILCRTKQHFFGICIDNHFIEFLINHCFHLICKYRGL